MPDIGKSSKEAYFADFLKVCFVCKDFNLNRGSYRIWIDDLNSTLISLGISSRKVIVDEVSDITENIILFDKGISEDEIINIRSKIIVDNKVLGVINPPADSNLSVDFAIAGSIEESSTLINYKKVFIIPLIEKRLHDNYIQKLYNNEVELKLCYHGNSFHLSAFESSGLRLAIEEFETELANIGKKVKLTIISESESPTWIIGKPKINNISYIRYNWETFPSILREQDIGLVPNCYFSQSSGFFDKILKKIFRFEYDKTDIIMRMKNKSNFGRLLVFMQLGVPAIADLTPSHLILMANGNCGYCVSNKQGWISSLRELLVEEKREYVARNARSFIDNNYTPHKWAHNFLEALDMEFGNYLKNQ